MPTRSTRPQHLSPERQARVDYEPVYFAYLDMLYARYSPAQASPSWGLSDLVPLLSAAEREQLTNHMRQAGYTWPGLVERQPTQLVNRTS